MAANTQGFDNLRFPFADVLDYEHQYLLMFVRQLTHCLHTGTREISVCRAVFPPPRLLTTRHELQEISQNLRISMSHSQHAGAFCLAKTGIGKSENIGAFIEATDEQRMKIGMFINVFAFLARPPFMVLSLKQALH